MSDTATMCVVISIMMIEAECETNEREGRRMTHLERKMMGKREEWEKDENEEE
jgi:hypothetical protein